MKKRGINHHDILDWLPLEGQLGMSTVLTFFCIAAAVWIFSAVMWIFYAARAPILGERE